MKANAHSIALLTATCFVLSCAQQFIMGAPSAIAASTGVSITEVGQLMTVFAISSAIGTPLLLTGATNMPQRRQLVIGLVLMTIGMTTMAITSNYIVLLLARVIMGVGNGTFVATANVIAASLAKPGHAVGALSSMALGFSLAQVLAMPLSRVFVTFADWHLFYAGLAVFAAIAIVLVHRFIPLDSNVAETTSSDAAPSPRPKAPSLRERLEPFKNPLLALGLLVMILINTGFASFYTYVSPFLEGVYGNEEHIISTLLLVSGLMSIVGSRGSGWLADRIGYKKTAIIALVSQAVTLACLGILHASPVCVAVFLCLWVMADWSFNPSQNYMLTKLAGSAAPMALALSGSALQLGSAAGSAIGGAILLVAPIAVLPIFSAGCVVVALAIEAYVIGSINRTETA